MSMDLKSNLACTYSVLVSTNACMRTCQLLTTIIFQRTIRAEQKSSKLCPQQASCLQVPQYSSGSLQENHRFKCGKIRYMSMAKLDFQKRWDIFLGPFLGHLIRGCYLRTEEAFTGNENTFSQSHFGSLRKCRNYYDRGSQKGSKSLFEPFHGCTEIENFGNLRSKPFS